MAAAATDHERRWLPVVAVLALLVAVVFGGYATATALRQPSQPPVTIGDTIRVYPLSGWELAGRGEVGGVPAAQLTRGTGTLGVAAPVIASDPDELLRTYVRQILEPQAEQLEVSEQIETLELSYGQAARVDYAGTFAGAPVRIDGQLTSVVTPGGVGILFEGWGAEGLFAYSVSDIEAMIASAEVVA